MNAVAEVSAQLRLELGDNENRVRSRGAMDIWNLEAAAEYVKASRLQARRQLEESIVYYERAIEFDPDFARPWQRLSITPTSYWT